MSTALSSSDMPLTARSPSRSRLAQWLREPLLHFVVLGGLLFAVDTLVSGRDDDPRTIRVDAAVDKQAIEVFKASRDRAPDKQELHALRRIWLDNEVLYREGLAMQLDKGDTAIRERVIFKALSVIDASTKLPAYDDKVLRAWFEKNRVKYDEPTRYNFREAVPAASASESEVRALAAALNAGKPGETTAGLRVFKGRPHDNLVQSYGENLAKALEASAAGEWRVLPSNEGLRVMQLESVTPSKPADFGVIRGIVLQDWTDATLSEQRSAAVTALTKKYTVKVEATAQ